MDDKIKTWLYDILSSINEIESYFVETPKMFEIYQKDLKTKRAIERNIGIIGEAMGRILKENKDIEISNSRKIVDVRNRIIDKAVDLAYRPQPFTSEAKRMEFLFELYEKYTADLFTKVKEKKAKK